MTMDDSQAGTRTKAQPLGANTRRVSGQPGTAVSDSQDTLLAKIHERPLQALVFAASVGFILGIVWRV